MDGPKQRPNTHRLVHRIDHAPGLGTTLGEAGVNIGTFHLGRRSAGGEAVLLLSIDGRVEEPLLWQVCRLPGVKRVKALNF